MCDLSVARYIFIENFITLSALIVQKNFQCQQQIKYFWQHQFQMRTVCKNKDGGIQYVLVGCA